MTDEKAKKWNFSTQLPSEENPYAVLIKYADALEEETGGQIEGQITELTTSQSEEITYALYLVVPALRNYSYRLIEVVSKNLFQPFPVDIRLYAKANVLEEKDVEAKAFEQKLQEFIDHPFTKGILGSISNYIQMVKDDQE